MSFDFGISGFRPRFVTTPSALPLDLLRSVVGRTLRASWVMWDVTADEWFPDGPVILDLDGVHIEFCAQKFDEISVTADEIKTTARIDWAGLSADLPLEWRKDAIPALRAHEGQRLAAIRIVEARWRTTVLGDRDRPERVGREEDWGWVLHGIELAFPRGAVTLFNALDENGVAAEAFSGEAFRTTPV